MKTMPMMIITAVVVALVVGSGVWLVKPSQVTSPGGVSTTTVTTTTTSPGTTGPVNVKIGCLWYDPASSDSWTWAFKLAIERIAARFPNVTYVVKESVAEQDLVDFAKAMIEQQGCNILIANTEYLVLKFEQIENQYPNVLFVGNTEGDITTGVNFIRMYPRYYQVLYLEGMIAGAITTTNHIGRVIPFALPETIKDASGFALGIQAVNPNAELDLLYTGSWYDPPTESAVAKTLISTYNVDVLTQQLGSAGIIDAADKAGIATFGHTIDWVKENWTTSKSMVISGVEYWDVMIEQIVKDYIAGVHNPKNLYFDGYGAFVNTSTGPEYTVDLANNGITGAAALDAMPSWVLDKISPDALALIKEKRQQMIDGVWDPFQQQLVDTNGVIRKPAGITLTPTELLTMDYYVKGIVAPTT